jgi:hypothetical protein
VNVQITHFSIKKKPRNILKWKLAGSQLYSARQDLSLGAESAIIFFRLQHGASGPHHERAVKAPTLLRHLPPADLLGTPSSLLGSRPSRGGLLTHPAPALLALGGAVAPPARRCSRATGAPVEIPSPARPPRAGRPQLARGSVAEDPARPPRRPSEGRSPARARPAP